MKPTPSILAAILLAAAFGLGAVVAPDNLPLAVEAQRRLVAENPNDAAAWNDLGNLLTLGGAVDDAEDAYERAVKLAPDRAAYRFNYALLLQQRGKLRGARQHYRRVVELTPGNAWAWYQLGAIAEARGREATAVDRYARALALEPSLAFPDVNPHVIESELLGEAMLRGYRGGTTAPQAPRVYEEPARITSLLLPAMPPPGALEDDVAEEAAERQAVQREMRGPTGQVPPPPEGAPAAARTAPGTPAGAAGSTVPRRVLTGDDLDASQPTNQVTSPGAGQRGGYSPPNRRQPRQPQTQTQPQPSVRYVPTPQVEAAPAPGRQVPPPTAGQDDGRELVPQTGPRYRPGLPSTGRLEMILDEGPASSRG